METQIYFPLQLWTACLWSRMTPQHCDEPRHASQHYWLPVGIHTPAEQRSIFYSFFSMYSFKTYSLFFLSSDSHFCHTSIVGLPPSSSQQHVPICLFFISSRFATVPKVISIIFSQTMLAGLLQYEWLCAQSFPILVHPIFYFASWTKFILPHGVIEKMLSL